MGLANAKISTKIYVSFGTVIAILTGLVAFSTYSNQTSKGLFSSYRVNSTQSNAMSALLEDLLEARLDVFRYRTTNASDAARGVIHNIEEIVDARSSIVTDAVDPAVSAAYDRIAELAERYVEGFELAEAKQVELAALTAQLDDMGPKARRDVSLINQHAYEAGRLDVLRLAGLVQEKLLLGRLYASKFLISPEQADLDRATTELNLAVERLDELARVMAAPAAGAAAVTAADRDEVAATRDLIQSYVGTLRAAGATVAARDQLFKERLDVIGPEIGALVENMVDRSVEAQDQLGLQALSAMARSVWVVGIAGLVCILFALAAALTIGRSVSTSIGRVVDDTTALASGDLERPIRGVERGDEVGAMAGALQVFQKKLIDTKAKDEAKRREDDAARARVEAQARLTEAFKGDIAELLASVGRDMADMKEANDKVQAVVGATGAQAKAIAGDAANSTSSVQGAAAAVNEMSSSINEIAASMQRSFAAVDEAVTQVESTDAVVRDLRNTSDQIDQVVAIINELAEQTNLLALNATIESARAGEAGKGFAVVANEVKQLALQTTKSTGQIGEQIKTVQGIAGQSVEAMASIKQSMEGLKAMITAVSASVEQQNAATAEIDKTTAEASDATVAVSDKIEGVARRTDETMAQSETMKERVARAAQSVSALQDNVARYLDDVAAI